MVLNNVIMEALRLQPPVVFSSDGELSEDSMIGDYQIKAGDDIRINLHGI